MEFENFYNFITRQIQDVTLGFLGENPLIVIVQILLIIFLFFFLYNKFIRGTNSENLVRGIFVLIIMWILSEVLIKANLQIFGVMLKTLVGVVTFGLIVIFQPELRKFLGYIGQGDLFTRVFLTKHKEISCSKKADVLKELIETIKYLSKFKIGGLIVIQSAINAANFSDVGTKINADVSQELLLTIFHPNTPLHDGAVVVLGDKILSAGVLLPLTEDPKLSWRYGTRHRAAIGVSEVSDSACIVISEETGDVSIALDGVLKKYEDLGHLKTAIERILGCEEIVAEEEKKVSFNFEKLQCKKEEQKIE